MFICSCGSTITEQQQHETDEQQQQHETVTTTTTKQSNLHKMLSVKELHISYSYSNVWLTSTTAKHEMSKWSWPNVVLLLTTRCLCWGYIWLSTAFAIAFLNMSRWPYIVLFLATRCLYWGVHLHLQFLTHFRFGSCITEVFSTKDQQVFARNCMTFSDLQWKLIFTKTPLPLGVRVGLVREVNSLMKEIWKIHKMSILHRKPFFTNPPTTSG